MEQVLDMCRTIRTLTLEVERRIAASQNGELFEGLDGKVTLPAIPKIYRKAPAHD